MTRDQAIEIARAAAYAKYDSQSYLPKSPVEARHFQPHEWVIDAILNAVADADLAAARGPCMDLPQP